MENRINYLPDLLKLGIEPQQFCFAQSAWLAALGLRPNSDLDIVLHPSVFHLYKPKIDRLKHVDVKINSKKFKELGCMDDVQLFNEFITEIDGYYFSKLSFYVNLLNNRLRQNVKVQKTRQILGLLQDYFQEYRGSYLISEDKFNEIKEDVHSYFM